MESRPQSGDRGDSDVVKRTRFRLLPTPRSADPRASLLAVFLQATVIAIILPALIVPVTFDLMRDDAGGPVVPERISFQVLLPTDGVPERRPARDGGDGRPTLPDAVPEIVAPLTVPSEVPSEVPPAPLTPREPVRTGPLIGGGGAVQGIRPSFTDQRLWVQPSPVVTGPIVPLNRADTLRLMLQSRAIAMMDSLARLPSDAGRQGDWTIDRNGKKYGIDQGFIRLGNFSIPTALLAMMPMNLQANPIAMDRARRLNSLRSEIQEQVARSIRDDEFRKAVQALRERKERERAEAAAARARQVPPSEIPVRPSTQLPPASEH